MFLVTHKYLRTNSENKSSRVTERVLCINVDDVFTLQRRLEDENKSHLSFQAERLSDSKIASVSAVLADIMSIHNSKDQLSLDTRNKIYNKVLSGLQLKMYRLLGGSYVSVRGDFSYEDYFSRKNASDSKIRDARVRKTFPEYNPAD